jgi:hypothetical protein
VEPLVFGTGEDGEVGGVVVEAVVVDVVGNLIAVEGSSLPLLDDVSGECLLLAVDRDVPTTLFDPATACTSPVVSPEVAARFALRIQVCLSAASALAGL